MIAAVVVADHVAAAAAAVAAMFAVGEDLKSDFWFSLKFAAAPRQHERQQRQRSTLGIRGLLRVGALDSSFSGIARISVAQLHDACILFSRTSLYRFCPVQPLLAWWCNRLQYEPQQVCWDCHVVHTVFAPRIMDTLGPDYRLHSWMCNYELRKHGDPRKIPSCMRRKCTGESQAAHIRQRGIVDPIEVAPL